MLWNVFPLTNKEMQIHEQINDWNSGYHYSWIHDPAYHQILHFVLVFMKMSTSHPRLLSVCQKRSYSFFILFLSLKRAILMGEQEAWPISCCDWRAWDLSGLKLEQGSEKVQTCTHQNEPHVTQECWYFDLQIYILYLGSNQCLSVTLIPKNYCVGAFFTIVLQKPQLIFKH